MSQPYSVLGGSAKYHPKVQLYGSLEKLRVSPRVMQLIVKWDAAQGMSRCNSALPLKDGAQNLES